MLKIINHHFILQLTDSGVWSIYFALFAAVFGNQLFIQYGPEYLNKVPIYYEKRLSKFSLLSIFGAKNGHSSNGNFFCDTTFSGDQHQNTA